MELVKITFTRLLFLKGSFVIVGFVVAMGILLAPAFIVRAADYGYGGGGGGGGIILPIVTTTVEVPLNVVEGVWFTQIVKRTDIIRDGVIDLFDFNSLMVNWGEDHLGNPADVDKDGEVGIYDFNLLMVYWGETEF
ncbi:MAG: hypothetical protein WC457_04965 [Patescibacteria group bacterium]